jgi:hypothetical protein
MHASNAVLREARFSAMENSEHCKGRRMRRVLCVYRCRRANLSEHKVSVATLNFMQRTVISKRKDNKASTSGTQQITVFTSQTSKTLYLQCILKTLCIVSSLPYILLCSTTYTNITKVWKIKVEVPKNF